MIVCIAEKPSVAREIATIIGANQKKDGYIEGNGYQVTWTFGHLCTLKEPHDYSSVWKSWNLNTLPMLPEKFGIKLINQNGIEKQFNTIKKLVSNATEIINCGDAGQEGELIQRWVLLKAQCKVPIKRLWISSLTEEAIKEGFQKLMPNNDFETLYQAGMARAIGDWLLGINATRLYTLKYGDGKNVLSIGRVQTPTLALVVNRFLEIENFKPEPFWELKTTYRDVVFNVKSGRFSEKEKAEIQLKEIEGKAFTIVKIEKKQGKEHPPKLFDLTSLQVECNKKFGFSADETLKIIQSLYEKKLTTYPRVDTTFLPNDMYPKAKRILEKLAPYQSFTESILKEKLRKSAKVFNDKKITDHHAIIPTAAFHPNMNPNEKKVFDIIAKRFIAIFYPDCKVANTNVEGETNNIPFKATGKLIVHPGWRVVFSFDKTKSEDKILPLFEKGEKGPHKPELLEKQTQPPKQYTEATLLRAMETAGKMVEDDELRDALKENGIGRPSTRANIIETLFRRKYIRREKKNVIPNPAGVELIKTIENDLIKSPELTGQWEKKLRDIEENQYDPKYFMYEMKKMVWEMVRDVKYAKNKTIKVEEEAQKKISQEKKTESKKEEQLSCPKCNTGTIVLGKTAWGCTNFKNCDFRLPLKYANKKLSLAIVSKLANTKKSSILKGVETEQGKKNGYLLLGDHFDLTFLEEQEQQLLCPLCKQGNIVKGKVAWGCTNFKQCSLRIPFVLYEKKISPSQMKQLVSKGNTNKIKGFVSVSGNKVDGKLTLKNGKIELIQD